MTCVSIYMHEFKNELLSFNAINVGVTFLAKDGKLNAINS